MFDEDRYLQEVGPRSAFDLCGPGPVAGVIVLEGIAVRGICFANTGYKFRHDRLAAKHGFGLQPRGQFGSLSDAEGEQNGGECSEEDGNGDEDFEQ
jgi:hypothetical protein